jgi:hypothetical protein
MKFRIMQSFIHVAYELMVAAGYGCMFICKYHFHYT